MKLIFLGPPGAGKGTIAALAAGRIGVPHISTGAMFREAIKNASELGLQVKAVIDSGRLVSDELTVAVVQERLARPDAAKGYILDGFPRTIPQAVSLKKISAVDAVINFELGNAVIIERLSGRRVCSACGETYHVKNMPSKKEGVCDKCGKDLIIRADDKEEAIRKRLEVYDAQTAPLIGFYEKEGSLKNIDSSKTPDVTVATLLRILGK